MPNKHNIQQWVDALRSNKYTQGNGALIRVKEDVVEYCCLGVACEVYLDGHRDINRKAFWNDYYSWGALPAFIVNWFGLADANPSLYIEGQRSTCISLNDGGRFNFQEIAHALEAEYILPK